MFEIRRGKNGALTLVLEPAEAGILKKLPSQLRQVLERPDFQNRLVQRLFPAAYKDQSREEEYRKLLGSDLLDRKLHGIEAFESTLASSRVRKKRVEVEIEPEKFDLWLGFVNDMRLLLGTALEIEEDDWKKPFDPEHPDAAEIALLHYLGWLEEALIDASGFEGLRLPPGVGPA